MGRKLIGVPQVHNLAVTDSRQSDEESDGQGETGTAEPGSQADDGPSAFDSTTTIKRTQDDGDWVDKIKDAIPIEIVTAWIAIDAILLTGDEPAGVTYLAAFAITLVATALHMWVDIELPNPGQDTWIALSAWKKRFAVGAHIALSVGAFVVWALFLLAPNAVDLGAIPFGPTGFFAPDEQFAAVLLVLYTLVGPQLVPDMVSKLLDVDVETVEEATKGTSN